MIIWTDVESSNLDERTGHLLEVALVVTDDDLNEQSHTSVVLKPVGVEIEDVQMDDVVKKMHTENGLIEDVKKVGLPLREAEQHLLAFVRDAFVWPNATTEADVKPTVPFAGSTVSFDRRWLREHMPALESFPAFSYRSIDVSSITELAKRWAPKVYEGRPKAGKAHRALADVRESISCLKYYRDSGFLNASSQWARSE